MINGWMGRGMDWKRITRGNLKWNWHHLRDDLDFPGGSDGKESAWNAGDAGSNAGLGRCPGKGNGNPLQYSCLGNSMERGSWWATVHGVLKSQTWQVTNTMNSSLVAQLVKCLSAMLETQVQSLGWDDPQEEGMATHSSIPTWRVLWTEESVRLQSIGLQKVGHDWSDFTCIHGETWVFYMNITLLQKYNRDLLQWHWKSEMCN